MSALGADVGNAQSQTRGELPLHIQVPGLDVSGPPGISRHINNSPVVVLSFRSKRSGRWEDVGDARIDLHPRAESLLVKES